MATEKDVELFLSHFRQKAKVFGLLFRDDRGKNLQTLLELEITPSYREDIIMHLEPEDFIEGPFEDKLYKMSHMWVFGKKVKKKDIYIKISMGMENSGAICISFHIAEHELKYKFK